MKLEKLLTLSQFVDLRDSKITHSKFEFEKTSLKFLGEIYRYNDFLKQPLKKEMFVNELEKPKPIPELNNPNPLMLSLYKRLLPIWEQAEKKVIFNLNQVLKYYYPFTKHTLLDDFSLIDLGGCVSLHELAEVTSGELELQNIEL